MPDDAVSKMDHDSIISAGSSAYNLLLPGSASVHCSRIMVSCREVVCMPNGVNHSVA